MLGWTCGDPPVRLGGNDLIFGTQAPGSGAGSVARLQLGSSAPFDHWDYRGDALIANAANSGDPANEPLDPFDLPAYPIDGTGPGGNLNVEYVLQHAFWVTRQGRHGSVDLADQHEIMLFARDPQEQAETMRSFVGNYADAGTAIQFFPGDWGNLWNVAAVPLPRGFVYPPSANYNLGTLDEPLPVPLTFPLVDKAIFWPNYVPVGPGTEPDGHSSVKAVKIINRGLCGRELPYYTGDPDNPGILETVVAEAAPAIAGGIVNADCHADVTVPWSQAGSFIDFTTEREDRQLGGFFFNMAERSSGYLGVQSKVLARAAIRFELFDGRLSSEGEMVHTNAAGGLGEAGGLVSDKVVVAVSNVLTRAMDAPLPTNAEPETLAETIYRASGDLQGYAGSDGYNKAKKKFNIDTVTGQTRVDLDATGGDDSVPPTTADLSATRCAVFVDSFRHQLKQGDLPVVAPILGLTPAERQQVWDAKLNETEVRNGKTVLKNFRCVHRPDNPKDQDPNEGICEYVVRAKRVNVFPDGVELVLLDDLKDINQAAYPVWVHAMAAQLTGTADALSNVCDPPRSQGATYTFRPFVSPFKLTSHGDRHFRCADSCTAFLPDFCSHVEEY